MKNTKWMIALIAVMACGLVAAGCGGSDSSSSSSTAAVTDTGSTSADTAMTDTTTDTTSSDSTTTNTGDATPDDVYNACVDAIKGTPAEAAAMPSCEQARNAFQQCVDQVASAPESVKAQTSKICQDAANKAIQTLQGVN